MKKILFEFLTIVVILSAVWFGLSRMDWMTIFNVEKVTKSTEEKLGDIFWEMYQKTETEISDTSITKPLDSLLHRICSANKIEKSKIKLHVIQNDDINAFALPNNHIVVNSGLITSCENEEELCGVVCHELAHLEKNHVMSKLVKDFGLSVLISISTGNGNSEIIRNAIKHLSSTAYDRKLESEADKMAVEYLVNAKINPEPFANFMYRLSKKENLPNQFYWISTHPASEERSKKIAEYIGKQKIENDSIFGRSKWDLIQKNIQIEN